MKRDFRTWMILLAFSLPVVAALFIGSIYFVNCGGNADCSRGDLAGVIHTSVPTLLPATLPAPALGGSSSTTPTADCYAPAATLLEAWVTAGSPLSQSFLYVGPGGRYCAATFMDLQPIFSSSNLWYPGSLACTTCHNPGLTASAAGLDLTSYTGILAGSHRATVSDKGTDILGGGDWNSSILNQVLFIQKQMPFDAPAGALADLGPDIPAGEKTASSAATPTTTSANQVPKPSNPGGPGSAVSLTGDPAAGATVFAANCTPCHGQAGKGGIANPGSALGTVPTLSPIDPLLKGADSKTFAMNIDMFIQHGSTPKGPNPFRTMPAWGDQNALTQQQIADVIAYLISLNK